MTFKLQIIQAEFGDSFILEFGTSTRSRYALIDGGPSNIYQDHLRKELLSIRDSGGHLDLVLLSHIDDDHVNGLLDLMDELCVQQKKGQPRTIGIDALWHNSFELSMGSEAARRYASLIARQAVPAQNIFPKARSQRSIVQGDKLNRAANFLGIPINPEFQPRQVICLDEARQPVLLDNLSLQVVGPTRRNLENLRKDWLAWLKKPKKRDLLAPSDLTVPNLSSLMVLAESEGKRILFTGDGRSDDLLEGLRQAGLLDSQDRLHVDILKLPHHGSARNVSKDFFKAVTAGRYLISANGLYNNPDLDTLIWIVEAARDQDRKIEILATNSTKSMDALVDQFSPEGYGYQLKIMDPGQNSMMIELASP